MRYNNIRSVLLGIGVTHLPMHPRPKRVGSSLVNMSASMGLSGLKPASLRAFNAAMPPITPSVPSYAPAKGIASACEPVTTAPAAAWQKG